MRFLPIRFSDENPLERLLDQQFRTEKVAERIVGLIMPW